MSGVKRFTVDAEGARLGIAVEGEGPALLVVGSSIYYPRTFSRRIRNSCTLVCADLPHFVSHGPGFSLDSISFDLYARCIEFIRAATGHERVVVLGHSHHGNIALEYARRHPGRVSHVVLVGSPPADISATVEAAQRYWQCHASEERKALLLQRRSVLAEQDLASRSAAEVFVARYVADAPLYWYDPCYDAAWLWRGMRFSMAGVEAFRNLYRDYELNRSSTALRVPVLIVMGRKDYAVPHVLWDDALPTLQDATFRLLEKSGHTPQLEQPEAFDDVLLGWLQDEGLRLR